MEYIHTFILLFIITHTTIKKKSSKKRSKKAHVKKKTSLSDEDYNITNMSHMTNFINQFEGVDPFNLQVVVPGE